MARLGWGNAWLSIDATIGTFEKRQVQAAGKLRLSLGNKGHSSRGTRPR